MEKSEDFQKIIDDFVKDLLISFPEYEDKFSVIDYDEYYCHCKKIYPENFFNILYENDELFKDEDSWYLLPDINFKVILTDDKLSDNSKKTIWKYLQLILFSVCKGVNDKDEFGDAKDLFEAINEDELQKKIEETMNEMRNVFFNDVDPCLNEMFSEQMGDLSNVENIFDSFAKAHGGISGEECSGNFFENTMNQDDLKEHLNGLMGGKIGNLAKEIAEEASKEFGFDENQDEKTQGELLQEFFKNPSKLLGIVKNIGGKLEEKLKSGQLKESELLEEAQEIMGKMKDMPGIKNMMSQMGMDGGKFDVKGMANKMQQSMKQSKMKERMQEKLRKNNESKHQKEGMVGNMTQVSEDTFVWNDENSNPTEPLSKSKVNMNKNTTNPKKRKKKKKKN